MTGIKTGLETPPNGMHIWLPVATSALSISPHPSGLQKSTLIKVVAAENSSFTERLSRTQFSISLTGCNFSTMMTPNLIGSDTTRSRRGVTSAANKKLLCSLWVSLYWQLCWFWSFISSELVKTSLFRWHRMLTTHTLCTTSLHSWEWSTFGWTSLRLGFSSFRETIWTIPMWCRSHFFRTLVRIKITRIQSMTSLSHLCATTPGWLTKRSTSTTPSQLKNYTADPSVKSRYSTGSASPWDGPTTKLESCSSSQSATSWMSEWVTIPTKWPHKST